MPSENEEISTRSPVPAPFPAPDEEEFPVWESSAALPVLADGGSMSNFLAYALLNSPSVAAAYEDWSAAVERITVARSRPDPKLTFSAYIQNDLTSLMPGLMQDLPGPGKLKSAAGVATAESRAQYFAFETALLQAAFEFKRAYFNLHFLDERLASFRHDECARPGSGHSAHADCRSAGLPDPRFG